MLNNSWAKFYTEMAQFVSSKSKDRSTKVGAVLVGINNEVLSIGYNGFPRGINDEYEEYHEAKNKLLVTEHAERNCIYNAARNGIKTEGSTMFLQYEPYPCADCTRAIIQCGISAIVGTNVPFKGKSPVWKHSMEISKQLLIEAGIEVFVYNDNKN